MNQKKTRNKVTKYGVSVTFRMNEDTLEQFKQMCDIKGTNYNKVLRELIDYYLRMNS